MSVCDVRCRAWRTAVHVHKCNCKVDGAGARFTLQSNLSPSPGPLLMLGRFDPVLHCGQKRQVQCVGPDALLRTLAHTTVVGVQMGPALIRKRPRAPCPEHLPGTRPELLMCCIACGDKKCNSFKSTAWFAGAYDPTASCTVPRSVWGHTYQPRPLLTWFLRKLLGVKPPRIDGAVRVRTAPSIRGGLTALYTGTCRIRQLYCMWLQCWSQQWRRVGQVARPVCRRSGPFVGCCLPVVARVWMNVGVGHCVKCHAIATSLVAYCM